MSRSDGSGNWIGPAARERGANSAAGAAGASLRSAASIRCAASASGAEMRSTGSRSGRSSSIAFTALSCASSW